MAKLILLSIVLVTVTIPMILSTRKSPKRTLRTIQIISLVFVVIWAWMCLTIYPQLVPVD